jgi:hypothetical protein
LPLRAAANLRIKPVTASSIAFWAAASPMCCAVAEQIVHFQQRMKFFEGEFVAARP